MELWNGRDKDGNLKIRCSKRTVKWLEYVRVLQEVEGLDYVEYVLSTEDMELIQKMGEVIACSHSNYLSRRVHVFGSS